VSTLAVQRQHRVPSCLTQYTACTTQCLLHSRTPACTGPSSLPCIIPLASKYCVSEVTAVPCPAHADG
jgi:hypothetical protein